MSPAPSRSESDVVIDGSGVAEGGVASSRFFGAAAVVGEEADERVVVDL